MFGGIKCGKLSLYCCELTISTPLLVNWSTLIFMLRLRFRLTSRQCSGQFMIVNSVTCPLSAHLSSYTYLLCLLFSGGQPAQQSFPSQACKRYMKHMKAMQMCIQAQRQKRQKSRVGKKPSLTPHPSSLPSLYMYMAPKLFVHISCTWKRNDCFTGCVAGGGKH